MRMYNYSIVSKGHTNMTVKQNKPALSIFDSAIFENIWSESNFKEKFSTCPVKQEKKKY